MEKKPKPPVRVWPIVCFAICALLLTLFVSGPNLVSWMMTPDPKRTYSSNFETPLEKIKIMDYGGGIHGYSWLKFTSQEKVLLKNADQYGEIPVGTSDSLKNTIESLLFHMPDDRHVLADSKNLRCLLYTKKVDGHYKRVQWFIAHKEKPFYYFIRK